ncbi:MAG: GDSL-type esterase/lipase family protein [Sphingobacteriaceae bacterium]
MRKITVSATIGCILLLILSFQHQLAMGQDKPQAIYEGSNTTFALKDSDRVVFLGNSLFENDLQYNYLELALTTRWSNQQVTFRNLGWSGDNVFGDARSYFTNPPTAYDLLIKQIKNTKPTLVLLAYGGIEAQEGTGGLPRFNKGLNQLLDTIDRLGAKTILLSPIPILASALPEKSAVHNKNLELYASEIAKVAATRGKMFIDLFNPIDELSKKGKISDNGIHLNETGYYYLAAIMEKALGLTSPKETITVNVDSENTEPVEILSADKNNKGLKFTIAETYLPLPLPAGSTETVETLRTLKINGLKKGFYTLTADGLPVITASAKEWNNGVEIRQGAAFAPAENLRKMIFQKNEIFFHQYRPQNRTYIVGFRSYEQGRHQKGLEDLNLIITYLEDQIRLNRVPKSIVYQITSVN